MVAAAGWSGNREPDNGDGKKRAIVKTDTIIRKTTILRKEIILRTDSVIESDSVVRHGVFRIVDGERKDPERVDNPVPSISAVSPVSPVSSVSPDTRVSDVNLPENNAEKRDSVAGDIGENEIRVPERIGGNYLWVPDSLKDAVSVLLKGHSKVVDDEKKIDSSELVTFRGDTLKMILRDRNLGRFDRGLFNYLFIPKGIWQFGITASYGEIDTKDLEVFDLMSDIDINGHIFSVRPYVSYFIRSNMGLGLRLGYTSGKGSVGSFKMDIDDDMNFNLKDITYRSESYAAEFIFTQYFGMARRGRVGIFNEVALALSSGNSDFIRPYAGELKQTHTNTLKAALNFSPGVSIFIMKEVSFNVSFGVFGFSLKNEKQTENGVSTGNRLTSGMNFRFNIFNINLGIAVSI